MHIGRTLNLEPYHTLVGELCGVYCISQKTDHIVPDPTISPATSLSVDTVCVYGDCHPVVTNGGHVVI